MNRYLRTTVRILAFSLVGAVLTEATRADESEWKVGLARVKITPEHPVFMAGYASRDRPFEKVTADLFATAMALEDRDGHLAVLVTTDLIGLSAAVAEPVCARLADKAGLKREQLLLTSAHPHTGPALSLDPVRGGGGPGDR